MKGIKRNVIQKGNNQAGIRNVRTRVAMRGRTMALFVVAFMASAATSSSYAQTSEKPIKFSVDGSIYKPARVPATQERIQSLKVPQGFSINRFADGLNKPRMVSVGNDGAVYVTDRDNGTLTMLRDTDNDGRSDEQKELLKKEKLHGIAIHNNRMFLATVKEVFVADIRKDGSLGELKSIIDDLPDGGQHGNRTLKFGPDGMLYISVGSTCNACEETNDENATILKASPDGTNRKIFAKGLRNTLGFDWHPETGDMYGMDHGIDWLGDDEQREELNHLQEGKDYGWPYIYGEGKENPADQPSDMSAAAYKKKTTYPVLTYTAHTSGLDMIFYKNEQFPEEYHGDAFVALHGSWNRSEPAGYKVVRIHFENGEPKRFSDFVSGFLVDNNTAQFGRVVGLAMLNDGSLIITDDENGVIYRVAYAGEN